MKEREIKSESNPIDSDIYIQDMVVVGDWTEVDIHPVVGEFGNLNLKAESSENTINRLYLTIRHLASEAAANHIDANFNEGRLKAKKKNHIFRMITNEAFFYTKDPFTQDQFEVLMQKLYQLAKSLPDNLVLILGSFAVVTSDNKIMNVSPLIQCGKNSEIFLSVKNNPSSVDPVYGNMQNVDIKIGDDVSNEYILINGKQINFTFNTVFVFKTAAGKKYFNVFDNCLDYSFEVGVKCLFQKINSPLENENKNTKFPNQCSHVLVSNTIELSKRPLGVITQADPKYSPIESKEGARILKSNKYKLKFGTPAISFLTKSLKCEKLPQGLLVIVNAHNDRFTPDTSKTIILDKRHQLENAIIRDDVESVKTILKNVNPEFVGKDGWTPLTRAVYYGNFEIVSEIVKSSPKSINYKDGNSRTPLSISVKSRNYNVTKLLLEKHATHDAIDRNGTIPIQDAIAFNNFAVVNLLVAYHQNLDLQYTDKETPLIQAAFLGNEEIINLLLHKGADPNYPRISTLHSPLSAAISVGNIHILPLLLEKGADPTIFAKIGESALSLVLKSSLRNNVKIQMLSLLLQNVKDNERVVDPRDLTYIHKFGLMQNDQKIITLVHDIHDRMNRESIGDLNEILGLLKNHDYKLNTGGKILGDKTYSKTAVEIVMLIYDIQNSFMNDKKVLGVIDQIDNKLQGKTVATKGLFFSAGDRDESTAKLYREVLGKVNDMRVRINSKSILQADNKNKVKII